MNVRYQRCADAELFSEDGDRYLDFLSGYCVHNTGLLVIPASCGSAKRGELDLSGPAMLQSHVPELGR